MKIILTVTTDLNFDQRMMRICQSLAANGYEVELIGRLKHQSLPLKEKKYEQTRLYCFFQKGKMFYFEYNIRLFFYLLFANMDIICAIDLDTILPCLWVSKWRNKKRVYDAHELFCEMDEIVTRPAIYKIWKAIEKYAVPQFKHGYTIGQCYADEFEAMYRVKYGVVRNATVLEPRECAIGKEKYILYQGAVNEGRCFEQLIPAMKQVNATLIVCGEGNFFEQARQLAKTHGVASKIIFKGYVEPAKLKSYTKNAYIGITLFSSQGKSNFLSMANRYFDYLHAGVPQLCMNYPEYKKVNEEFEVAVLINHNSVEEIALSLQELLNNEALHLKLQNNCWAAREVYCWQIQETNLLKTYAQL